MSDRKQYVIYGLSETWDNSKDCEPMFWLAEEKAWVQLKNATKFEPKETKNIVLPTGGKWVTTTFAKSLVGGWKIEMEDPDSVPDLIKGMPCWGKEQK